MAMKRISSNHRNRGGFPINAVVVFFSLLAPLVFFVGRGRVYATTSIDHNDSLNDSSQQHMDWRVRLALLSTKSLLSKEVLDVVTVNTADTGPLSLDSLTKKNFSASWVVSGESNSAFESNQVAAVVNRERSARNEGKSSSDDHSQFIDTPAKLIRRQLREKRREKRAADLSQRDDETIIKLQNVAIERSKSVDGAVLGKYNIWRKENKNENVDTTVCLMRDQLIMARVYLSISKMKKKDDLFQELQSRVKESQRALGEVTADSDLPHSAPEKMKGMGQVLSKARHELYDCKLVTGKLRAMLQTADEQVRSLKKTEHVPESVGCQNSSKCNPLLVYAVDNRLLSSSFGKEKIP